ncbi:MAG: penicillin-binding protein 1C [Bacteroidetes bacterium]|nr:penicillin-binding protein 1C [Bacteroidota bacterium]
MAVTVVLLLLFWFSMPKRLFSNPTSFVIEDNQGNLLSATIASDGQWRFPYNNTVPEKFIDCITTFEDKRFFIHPGVDIVAISRAVIANTRHSKTTQGGSTITMQVARIASKHESRNVWNKLRETLMAVRLELSYSKKEILALYASNAPFGSNVVGLDAAAWRYFGRSADKLSWAEMATLAILPNAPSLVHPGKNREILLAKRNGLLDKLFLLGKLTKEDCALAKLEPLPGKPLPLPQYAPHLLQRYRKEYNGIGQTKLRSTVDGTLQQAVTRIIEQQQQLLKGNGINNICALVLNVETGNTLAYVGNVYQPSNKNLESDVDVINAPRSPGSTLKPVLYAAMLSDGMILPDALVPDIPTEIGGYTPQNFDLGYDGAVPASKALSRSLNIPAVRLLQQYKYQRFYEVLQQCGINTLTKPADFYGLSLILGGCEVKMWELAGLYASFARSLKHQTANRGIAQAEDFHPPKYYETQKEKKNEKSMTAIDPTSIYFTFQAMQEVMRPGEEGLWQQFSSSQKIAWKTGTSFGFRDGWAIGVTPENVVAVWVGNTTGEGRPGLIGVNTAAPVMFDIFRLLPNVSWFEKPKYNYSYIPVCRQSGYRSNIDCTDVDTLFMPFNAIKSPLCPYHKMIQLDAGGAFQVNESCASPAAMIHKGWFVLSPSMEYYYKQRNHDYKLLPPFKPGCVQVENSKQMELLYPQPDAKIYVPVEINGEKGKTIFTAAHRDHHAKIFWSLDDQFITTTETTHQVAISPSPGKHLITLTDDKGNNISRSFEIIDKEKN